MRRVVIRAAAMLAAGGFMLAAGGLMCSCTPSESVTPVERGQRVYMANCIVCHNTDPAKPGAAGPEVAGASRQLLEARVIHGTYPPGYAPKRTTKAMVPLPFLAPRLDDLEAFLATAGNDTPAQ